MSYYSAKLHVVCLVDDANTYEEYSYTSDYPIVIFKATDFEDAFQKALRLGKDQEHQYKNGNGADVRWALNAVEALYFLGDDIDGVEVGSMMDVYHPNSPLRFDQNFSPELKPPRHNDNSKQLPTTKVQ